jgi:hypothetical protein
VAAGRALVAGVGSAMRRRAVAMPASAATVPAVRRHPAAGAVLAVARASARIGLGAKVTSAKVVE